MSITPIGAVIILFIIVIIARRRSELQKLAFLFGVLCAISINNLAGYAFAVGNVKIACEDILMLTCTIYIFCLTLRKGRIYNFSSSFALIVVVSVTILCGYLFQANTLVRDYSIANWDIILIGNDKLTLPKISMQTFLMFGKLVCFILIVSFYKRFATAKEICSSKDIVYRSVYIHLSIVFIELFLKAICSTSEVTDFIRVSILGGSSGVMTGIHYRGGMVALYGLTNEASHLAETLFMYLALVLICRDIKRHPLINLFSVVVLLIAMSFSALMYFAILVCMFIVQSRRPLRSFLFAGAISIIAVLFIFAVDGDYYLSRINGLFSDISYLMNRPIDQFGEVTSSKVRIYGMLKTFEAFMVRPLLGLGLGTAYCNSGIICILVNVGLIGLLAWIVYLISLTHKNKRNLRHYVLVFLVVIAPNLFNGDLSIIYDTTIALAIFLIDHSLDFKIDKVVYNEKGRSIVKLK